MKYKFQNLLTKNEDKVTGPMSPVLFVQDMAKHLDFKIDGIARIENFQSQNSTYDHLIVLSKYKNFNEYKMFVDMGSRGLPIAICFSDNWDVTITPIYKKAITPEAQKEHALDMEQNPKYCGNPIMNLNEKELIDIFKQAEKERIFEL